MGLFDRLRGRGRYAAGTTPESAGESPPAPPEWAGTAPPERPETTVRSETVEVVSETHELPEYVTAEDLAGAYGWASPGTEQDLPVDDVVTHTAAAGAAGESLHIYVCDHRAHPAMALEDEAAWRAAGPVEELSGVGDVAFVNDEGTVFARVGEDWTVQVATGAWQPPVEQTVDLVRRIVKRLGTAAPPDQPARPGTD